MKFISKFLILLGITFALSCHNQYPDICKKEMKPYKYCYDADRETFYGKECQDYFNKFFDLLPGCKKALSNSIDCELSLQKYVYGKLIMKHNSKDENGHKCPLFEEEEKKVNDRLTESYNKRLLEAAKKTCKSKQCTKYSIQVFELFYESEKLDFDYFGDLYSDVVKTLKSCSSTDGKECGKGIGKCPSNQCCSKYGYCGTTDDYCSADKGCQSEFGKKCTSSKTPNKPADGRCGKEFNKNCPYGTCCSKYGYCGTSDAYCSIAEGCQIGFGSCLDRKTKYPISKDDRCGVKFGTQCPSGECCSKHGYCGTSEDHCGAGCQSDYGKCNTTKLNKRIFYN